MLMKNIQTKLLSAFESSGLTYDELAKRTNLPKSALYRYLNGDTEKIPIDRFQSVCNELHVEASSILGWKDDHPQEPPEKPLSQNARILAQGFDKLPKEQQEKALAVFRVMFEPQFAHLFTKGTDDNDA